MRTFVKRKTKRIIQRINSTISFFFSSFFHFLLFVHFVRRHKYAMLREKTQIVVIPKEIIYSIFEFPTTLDILRAFARLTHRYTDLV